MSSMTVCPPESDVSVVASPSLLLNQAHNNCHTHTVTTNKQQHTVTLPDESSSICESSPRSPLRAPLARRRCGVCCCFGVFAGVGDVSTARAQPLQRNNTQQISLSKHLLQAEEQHDQSQLVQYCPALSSQSRLMFFLNSTLCCSLKVKHVMSLIVCALIGFAVSLTIVFVLQGNAHDHMASQFAQNCLSLNNQLSNSLAAAIQVTDLIGKFIATRQMFLDPGQINQQLPQLQQEFNAIVANSLTYAYQTDRTEEIEIHPAIHYVCSSSMFASNIVDRDWFESIFFNIVCYNASNAPTFLSPCPIRPFYLPVTFTSGRSSYARGLDLLSLPSLQPTINSAIKSSRAQATALQYIHNYWKEITPQHYQDNISYTGDVHLSNSSGYRMGILSPIVDPFSPIFNLSFSPTSSLQWSDLNGFLLNQFDLTNTINFGLLDPVNDVNAVLTVKDSNSTVLYQSYFDNGVNAPHNLSLIEVPYGSPQFLTPNDPYMYFNYEDLTVQHIQLDHTVTSEYPLNSELFYHNVPFSFQCVASTVFVDANLEQYPMVAAIIMSIAWLLLILLLFALLRSISTKENEVTVRTALMRELDDSREKAENAANSKSDFMAFLCHELRNPLHAVISMADSLKDTSLNADQSESVFTISASSELMLAITNDILDLSKIEAGKIELEYIPVDVPTLIRSVARANTQWAASKGVSIHARVDPTIPSCIYADPIRLNQMITNLVSNSIKFTPPSGQVIVEVNMHPDFVPRHVQLEQFQSSSPISTHGKSLQPNASMFQHQPSSRALQGSTMACRTPNPDVTSNPNVKCHIPPSVWNDTSSQPVDVSSQRHTIQLHPRGALTSISHMRSHSNSATSDGVNAEQSPQPQRLFSADQQKRRSLKSIERTPNDTDTLVDLVTPDNKVRSLVTSPLPSSSVLMMPPTRVPTRRSPGLNLRSSDARESMSSTQVVTLQFKVIDTGIGIPKEYMSALFEPYSQAKRSMTREHGGTGLGLAIVERLGDLMNGWFDVTSQLGKGSTFTFSAPFQVAPPPSPVLKTLITNTQAANNTPGIRYVNYTTLRTHPSSTFDNITVNECRVVADDSTLSIPSSSFCPSNAARSMDTLKQLSHSPSPDAAVATRTLPIQCVSCSHSQSDASHQHSPEFNNSAFTSNSQLANDKQLNDGNCNEFTPHHERATSLPIITASPIDSTQLSDASMVTQPSTHHSVSVPYGTSPPFNSQPWILVVDDSFINRKIMMKMLSNDYQLDQAENGLNAVQMIDQEPHKYSCVLMDLMMPVMGGTEALTQIQKRGHTVPVIAVTANTMNEDVEKCLSMGFAAFLSKPCRREQVRSTLQSVMSTHASQLLLAANSSHTNHEHSMQSGVATASYNKHRHLNSLPAAFKSSSNNPSVQSSPLLSSCTPVVSSPLLDMEGLTVVQESTN